MNQEDYCPCEWARSGIGCFGLSLGVFRANNDQGSCEKNDAADCKAGIDFRSSVALRWRRWWRWWWLRRTPVPTVGVSVGADGEGKSQSQESVLEKVLHVMSFWGGDEAASCLRIAERSGGGRFYLTPERSASRSCRFASETTTVARGLVGQANYTRKTKTTLHREAGSVAGWSEFNFHFEMAGIGEFPFQPCCIIHGVRGASHSSSV